jgi:peptidoglycan hydrolase-like protein with peptidoglycan-binding domain
LDIGAIVTTNIVQDINQKGNYTVTNVNKCSPPHQNSAPTANAGPDQTITLPTDSVTLDGSGSSNPDGIGTIASYVWSFVSGPSTIDPADTVSPSVTGLVAGTYVFQLIVTDNEGAPSPADTVSIVVNPVVIDTVVTPTVISHSSGGSFIRGGGFIKPVGQVLGAQTSCGIYVDKYLRKGYDNDVETVKKVQTFLNDYMKLKLVVDGIYGPKTETAIRAFQLVRKDRILSPWGITASTGIFYLTTQTEVNNIMCPDLNLPIPLNLINFTPGVIR